MRVTVEYFGPARDAAETAAEQIDASGSVLALVRQVVQTHPRLAALLMTENQLANSTMIAVNDRQILPAECTLRDGDVVAIIPPISGGARCH